MKDLFDCFKQAKTFLIVSHYHPDGDALGSAVALGLGLQQLKKQVVIYNRDRIPYNLSFLSEVESVTQNFPQTHFDAAVMVDCAQPKRVSDAFAGALEQKRFGKLVCIDHHLLDHPVGDIDWIEPEAASTGAVIWHLLKKLKVDRNRAIANLIFCTLTVDTGSFRYSNTTASVFGLAQELVAAGADPWFIARNLDEDNPVERFRLLQHCLVSLTIDPTGRYALMEVTQKMLQASGAKEDLSEEFANIPRSIQGVEVAALFREMKDDQIKVSLRSKERVDVSKIAKQFGGGGHEHAAGCVLDCDLVSAEKQIEQAVLKCL